MVLFSPHTPTLLKVDDTEQGKKAVIHLRILGWKIVSWDNQNTYSKNTQVYWKI